MSLVQHSEELKQYENLYSKYCIVDAPCFNYHEYFLICKLKDMEEIINQIGDDKFRGTDIPVINYIKKDYFLSSIKKPRKNDFVSISFVRFDNSDQYFNLFTRNETLTKNPKTYCYLHSFDTYVEPQKIVYHFYNKMSWELYSNLACIV